jgi:hypothetical protein
VIGLLVALILIALITSYLLFAPFYLEVNSNTGLLGIRLHRLASVQLKLTRGTIVAKAWVLGWNKEIDLLKPVTQAKRAKKAVLQAKGKKPFKLQAGKIKAVARSFKVNKCLVNIDTGDMQLNGLLYPVFYWIGRRAGKPITVNFLDKNEVVLEIENNIARMAKAYFFH